MTSPSFSEHDPDAAFRSLGLSSLYSTRPDENYGNGEED